MECGCHTCLCLVVVGLDFRFLLVIHLVLGVIAKREGLAHLPAFHGMQEVPRPLGGRKEGDGGVEGSPFLPLGLKDGLGADGMKAEVIQACLWRWCPAPPVPGLATGSHCLSIIVVPSCLPWATGGAAGVELEGCSPRFLQ